MEMTMKALAKLSILCLLSLSTGCASNSALVSESAPEESAAAAITAEALERGCEGAATMKMLSTASAPEEIEPLLKALLAVPAGELCWLSGEGACTRESCAPKSTLGSLAALLTGDFGIKEALEGGGELKLRFTEQLAQGLDALAEQRDGPPVSALSEGLDFDVFKATYAGCCEDADAEVVSAMIEQSRASLLMLAIQAKLPATMERAEKALASLKESKADKGAVAEKEAVRALAIQKREQARLRSELQRRLLELQEAGERARRAAEVIRAARENPEILSSEVDEPVAKAEEVVVESAAPVNETYERLCRARGETQGSERASLQVTLDDVYCLIMDAEATPNIVPKAEMKRLNTLYASLHKTSFELALEELRWALADPTGARTLMDGVDATPLIKKATKKRMITQVKRVCTARLSALAKSDHEDIILAERWIDACFGKDASAERKWHRKIAGKLKDARIWQERLAAEKERQEKASQADAQAGPEVESGEREPKPQ